MWLLPTQQHNFVTISCTPHNIACAWLRSFEKKPVYELKGYKRITLDRFEMINGYIYNLTIFEHHISSFLMKHTLKNAFIIIGLRGPNIYENIVAMPATMSDPVDNHLPKKQQQLWASRYLYSQENAHSAFYLCSIPQSLLFQFQLIAQRRQLNLIGITTLSMAYLNIYRFGYGTAFRHSQLAHDMARCNNVLDNVVPFDIVRRCLIVPAPYSNNLEYERATLTPLLGLAMNHRGYL